jgi:hypothetical protein
MTNNNASDPQPGPLPLNSRRASVDLTLVRDAATRFRRALEDGELETVTLAKFPKGACGDASELLGQYLTDIGLGQWSYRRGNDESRTHAWIERDDVIVDITGDQFDDVSEPVTVTTDHSWHDRRFPSSPGTRIAGLSYWDGPALEGMERDYAVLKHRADSARRDRATSPSI